MQAPFPWTARHRWRKCRSRRFAFEGTALPCWPCCQWWPLRLYLRAMSKQLPPGQRALVASVPQLEPVMLALGPLQRKSCRLRFGVCLTGVWSVCVCVCVWVCVCVLVLTTTHLPRVTCGTSLAGSVTNSADIDRLAFVTQSLMQWHSAHRQWRKARTTQQGAAQPSSQRGPSGGVEQSHRKQGTSHVSQQSQRLQRGPVAPPTKSPKRHSDRTPDRVRGRRLFVASGGNSGSRTTTDSQSSAAQPPRSSSSSGNSSSMDVLAATTAAVGRSYLVAPAEVLDLVLSFVTSDVDLGDVIAVLQVTHTSLLCPCFAAMCSRPSPLGPRRVG